MNVSLGVFVGIILFAILWYLVDKRRQAERESAEDDLRRQNRRPTAWDGLHNFDVRPTRRKAVVDTSANYFDYQAGQ